MSEIVLTNQNFEAEVMQSDIPVLVDFWAVWCGPCKMLAPIVAEIAQEYEGKVKVGKVNVDIDPVQERTAGSSFCWRPSERRTGADAAVIFCRDRLSGAG